MQQLTNQEKAKVFSMYLGCPVYDSYNEKEGILFAVDINTSGMDNIKVLHKVVWDLKYYDCKLLLTPLSSITDDDAIEVAKIHLPIFYNDEFEFETRREVKDKLFVIVFRKGGVFYEKIPIQLYSCSPLVFQYLVSKSYAVPLFFGINHCANGKTAIELGIAIDKNKQNG